jgi:hypothetical protein
MFTAYGIVTLFEWPWWSYSTQVEREGSLSLSLSLSQPVYCIKFCGIRSRVPSWCPPTHLSTGQDECSAEMPTLLDV